MRFNEKELVFLSRQPPERAAELGMRGPKKGDGKRRPFHPDEATVNREKTRSLPLKSTTTVSFTMTVVIRNRMVAY